MTLKAPGGGEVDPYLYLDPPLLDTSGLLALGRAILDCAPVAPPASLLGPLRRLRQACDELQSHSRSLREAATQPVLPPRLESRQPADFAADNAWTALYERLRAYVMLPESEVPRVKRGGELLRILFPDGLGFLRLPYEAEWAESDRRLRSVEQLKLTADIDALAGVEFLAEVKRAHEVYGRVLGRRADGAAGLHAAAAASAAPAAPAQTSDPDRHKEKESAESPVARELRQNLARCISAYAVKVLALTVEDTKDTKDTKDVKRWLAPLAAYQRAESRRTTASAGTSGTAGSAGTLAAGADRSGEQRRVVDSGPFRTLPTPPAADPGVAGVGSTSGHYRSVGESGQFRTIKRPPPSDG